MIARSKKAQRISALEIGLIGALLIATLIGGAGVLGIDVVTAMMAGFTYQVHHWFRLGFE